MMWPQKRHAFVLGVAIHVVMLAALLVGVVGLPGAVPADLPLDVAVTIPPQADLVERIAGNRARVEIAVPPGQDPHTFSPSPRQVMSLGRAKLYFRIGLPIEDRLVAKLVGSRRTMTVVDTTEGMRRRTFAAHEGHICGAHHRHHHGHDCQAHAGRPDPHVWLAPRLLAHQAEQICEALCQADPAGAELYRANAQRLQAQLEEIEADILRKLKPFRGRAFYVFHPAFGHFADACGLRQIPVEIEGKSPSARQLRTLIAQAKAEQVKVVFVQPQFDQRSAEAVAAAIGGSLVTIDPLRQDAVDGLVEIATQLQRGFER